MRTVRLTRLQAHDLYHELKEMDVAPRKELDDFLQLKYLDVSFEDANVRVTWRQPRERLGHDA